MRLTPTQVGMLLMICGSLPMMSFSSAAEGIARGRQELNRITGKDFGYDPVAWHDYLVATNAGGYKWSNERLSFPMSNKAALTNKAWQEAVELATSESLFELLNERELRQHNAVQDAELKWAGKPRRCPKCEKVFTSSKNRWAMYELRSHFLCKLSRIGECSVVARNQMTRRLHLIATGGRVISLES
jgi:hypothetical protein